MERPSSLVRTRWEPYAPMSDTFAESPIMRLPGPSTLLAQSAAARPSPSIEAS